MLKIVNSARCNGVTYARAENVSLSAVIRDVTAIGYKRVDRIENLGEFSVRGDILDIYCYADTNIRGGSHPPNPPTPLRIMFFGDEIEAIKEINFASYATVKNLDYATIEPFPDGVTVVRVRGEINMSYNEIQAECYLDANAPTIYISAQYFKTHTRCASYTMKCDGYSHSDLTHFKPDTAVGGLVMHERYGLGRYLGAKRVDIGAGVREYFVVQYDRKAVIYVPVAHAEVLYNYHGSCRRLDRI